MKKVSTAVPKQRWCNLTLCSPNCTPATGTVGVMAMFHQLTKFSETGTPQRR